MQQSPSESVAYPLSKAVPTREGWLPPDDRKPELYYDAQRRLAAPPGVRKLSTGRLRCGSGESPATPVSLPKRAARVRIALGRRLYQTAAGEEAGGILRETEDCRNPATIPLHAQAAWGVTVDLVSLFTPFLPHQAGPQNRLGLFPRFHLAPLPGFART
jgi:hypothetical protein